MKKKMLVILIVSFSLILSISMISASENNTDNNEISEINTIENNNNENVMNQNVERSIKTENKNIIINSNNFDEYVTDGKFNDKVSDGDTVDFQGKFDSSRFNLTVNKTLNITGFDNNYINLNGESIFKINSGASGSNITGINFEHTRIMIENVTNLNFNNCSVIAEHNVGFGVGMFSVRDGSDNITISNSYFETANNGGHSNVVFAGATNVLFENNTIVGKSTVGNLLYLTTYNSPSENLTYGNQNITIRNNYINGNEVHIAEICYAIALEGNNILIENNTVEYNGKCIVPQWGQGKQNNITIINNTIPYGTCYLSFPNQTTKGNILNNVQSNNNVLCNNTIKNITTLGNLTLEKNNIETITINGSNILINNNNITTTEDYAITIIDTSDNVSIINNKIASGNGQGLNAINGTPTTNENNSATNRIIYINNENIENFFTIKSTSMQNQYTLKDNIYENDTIVLSLTETSNKTSASYNLRNVPSINIVNSTIISDNLVSFTINSSSKLINSTILLGNINAYNSSVINCTVFNVTYYNESIDNIEVSKLIQNGNYVLKNTNKTINRIPFIKVVNSETGLLNENIIEGDNIYVNGYNNETTNIIIDRPINLIGLNKICTINSNITFIEGSEESNITNITFNGTVNVNTTNINFFEGNTFNGEVNNPYLPETNIPIQINMDYSNQVVNNVPSPVNINVTTTKDVPLTNGYIEVYADGILQDKLNITGSIVHTNITIKRVLNTTIRVWYYPEDNTYLENNTIFNITSIKSNVTLTVENNTVRVNENETVSVLVTADNNQVVNSGNVTFIIRNWKFDVPVEDGMAKLNLIINESWYERPNLRLIYSGSDLYNSQSTSNIAMNILEAFPITLQLDNTEFTAGANTTIQASIYKGDDVYTQINKGKVTFKVNGKTLKDSNGKVIYAKVVNGTAIIENYEIPSTWDNNTTIEATYTGSAQQATLKSEKTNVTITATQPAMSINNITSAPSETIQITAQITQSDNPINTGKVIFKINGKTVKDSNGKVIYAKVTDGVATINYTIPENMKIDTYEIKAIFTATGYEKLESTGTLTIARVETS